jgi:hypothetical protein
MTRSLLIATFAVATCCVALAQAPSRFSASIDNFEHHRYALELRDGKLVYSDATPKSVVQPVTITPSPDQWREFRRALDRIDIWTWHETYRPNEVVFDGTNWSLSVRYPDRSLVSGGSNSYPDALGAPTGVALRPPAFRQFEAAVEALLGGKSFRSADDAANR